MAVSIEAAFVLIDKASGPLKKIERQALATDKALRGMGGGGGGLPGATRQYKTYGGAIGEVQKVTEKLGQETEKTAKKVESAGGFFRRTTTHIKNWTKALVQSDPVLKGFVYSLGGLVGGLKGAATAFPPMVWAALAAAPAIVALTGTVTALVSSLGLAVGGGALLGGGLLGSFAVGLGSIVAIAKPAITATQNYEKAVKNLNTAIASGSPTMIKRRQKELDAIAKANPGVAKLSGNLKSFEAAWKKATAPGRASFFKLANDGIGTMRKLLPALSREANLNTAALEQSFRKILSPFLESKVFTGFIGGLGKIFRSNLPGFMTGVVNIFSGLANVLKILTPQLEKAGPAFAKFTGHFAKWTGTAGGKASIKDMGKAFTAWLDLLKQILRLIGTIMGVAGPKGTGVIAGWADKLGKLVDKLQTPGGKKSLEGFFTRALDDADKLADLLKPIAKDLAAIYTAFKPLGSVTAFVIKHLPGPALAAAMWAIVGVKGITGAKKGFDVVKSVFGGKRDGQSVTKGLYVTPTGPFGGGGGLTKIEQDAEKGAKGGLLAKILSKVKSGVRLTPSEAAMAGEAEAFGATFSAGSVIAGLATGAGVLYLSAAGIREFVKLVGGGLNAKQTASLDRVQSGKPESQGGTQFNRSRTSAQAHTTVATPTLRGYEQNPLIGTAGPSAGTAASAARGNGPGFLANITRAITGTGASTSGYLGKVGNAVKTFTDNLPTKLTKPLQAETRKGADAFKQMRTQGSTELSTLSTNLDTEVGKQKTTVSGLQTAVDSGISHIVGNVNKVLGALGVGKIFASGLASSVGTAGQGAGAAITNVGKKVGGNATGGRLPGRPQGDHLPLFGRGGSLLGIADGGELVVNRHTEARVNAKLASHGTTLGREVAGETKAHFATGGRVPRFAGGGAIPYGQLEGLWTAAGGPPSAAAVMAAIAMAESGGRNIKQAGQPYATTGWGLWQITPGNSVPSAGIDNALLIPMNNARAAVSKFQAAGGYGPWTTYSSGRYRGFLQGNVPASAYAGGGGGAVPHIGTPRINGPAGALTGMGRAMMGRLAGAANQYLAANAGGGGAVPGGQGVVMDPSGKPVAGWIEPILQWARQHGWGGSVTSGYRSFAEQSAIYNSGVRPAAVPGSSNHEGSQYPRGAVDVSSAAQLSAVLSHSPYGSTLVWAGAKDPVHFSHPHGGSYALGGRVPWFANGTDFIANRPQVIGVGDRPGGERVTVTPTGQGRIGNQGLHVEIHHIEVNRKGDIQKIVDEELQLLAATIERHT